MLKNLTILSSLIIPLCLHAQTAADYLHGGAQDYIFGKEDSAKAKLTEGIRRFPTDEEIRAVLALIREEQKSKQSKSEQDEKKDQKQNDQKSGTKNEPGEKKDGQEQKDGKEAENSPAKDGKPEPKPGEKGDEKKGESGDVPDQPEKKLSGEVKANPSQAQDEKNAREQEEAAAEAQAAAEGKMTERQARALLDSLKSEDERVRLLDPNERKRAGRVLRDW